MDIEEFEKFVEVVEGLLWFGVRPTKNLIKKEFVDNDVRVVCNLRKPAEKADVCWYAETLEGTDTIILKYPFESGFEREGDEIEMASCEEIIRCAKEIATRMRGDYPVFVHGFGAMEYATVVSLLAWYMYRDEPRFDPLAKFHKRLKKKGMEQYVDDFPKGQQYIDLLGKCIHTMATGIETAFKRTKPNPSKGV